MNNQYNSEKWSLETKAGRNIFIWKFFPNENEIPGWKLVDAQINGEDKDSTLKEYYWENKENKEEAIKTDVIESSSWRDAQKMLLYILENHMAMNLPEASSKNIELGDIAYIGYGEIVQHIIFSRANMTVRLSSIGNKDISVVEVAKKLDEIFYKKSHPSEKGVLPVITSFSLETEKINVGQNVRLNISAADPLERSLWFKFISEQGEIFLENGNLVFLSEKTGKNNISVFVTNENGYVSERMISFTTN